MLRPKEKCALNVNLSLRVWVCVHARTGLYIWGCDCVFLCFNVCCFYCLFFLYYIFFFCLCHKPWCDCSSHVCACVGTSYQHHECRCCQFDFIFYFFAPKVLSLVFTFALRCRVIWCRKDGLMTRRLLLFFWIQKRINKHTAPVSWTHFDIVNLIIETKPAWTI